MLDKKTILGAKDLPTETIDVPEWGGQVIVRTLSGLEKNVWESGNLVGNKVNLRNMTARLCAICIVDEKGKRLFSDADAESLGRKSAKALERVFDVAQRLNGMGADDIKEMAKNSGRAIAADSTSG